MRESGRSSPAAQLVKGTTPPAGIKKSPAGFDGLAANLPRTWPYILVISVRPNRSAHSAPQTLGFKNFWRFSRNPATSAQTVPFFGSHENIAGLNVSDGMTNRLIARICHLAPRPWLPKECRRQGCVPVYPLLLRVSASDAS